MKLLRPSLTDPIIIFLGGLFCFTIGLQHTEIMGFESRFYLFALEMWRHGPSWFPTTYRTPYADYPGTSTFLIYLTAHLMGGMSKLAAVLPSAIAASITLSITYLIGALHTRSLGWYAAGFLLFTLAFLTEARTISLDMFVTTVTACTFYVVYSAKLRQQHVPVLLIILLLICGFMIRGPLGLVIPTSLLCVFYLLYGESKHVLLVAFIGLGLLLICTSLLLFIAYDTAGQHFMQEVLRMQVFGRLQENRTPPWYFYFVENIGAYAITYPLCIFILLGIFLQLCQRKLSPDLKFLQILLGWILIILTGLSMAADKKIRYVLSISPPLALFCSYLLITSHPSTYFIWLRKLFYFICGLFPLIGLAVLALLYHHQIDLNYVVLTISFIMLQSVMLLLRNRHATFLLALITFVFSYIAIVEPINFNTNKTAQFVQNIENLRKINRAQLIFYREGPDGLAIKYLADMPQEDDPIFITDINAALKKAFIITSTENVSSLPLNSLHIIAHGKIGHDTVIVFSKTAPHPQ